MVSVDPILHNYFTHLNFYGVEVVPPAPPRLYNFRCRSWDGGRSGRNVQSLKQDSREKLTPNETRTGDKWPLKDSGYLFPLTINQTKTC